MSEESQKSVATGGSIPVFESSIASKVTDYKKEIIGGTILVIVAALIIGVVVSSQNSKEEATWNNIFKATATAGSDTNALEEKLNAVITDDKGANALFYAYMIKLDTLGSGLDRDNLMMAKNAASAFLSEYPLHPFAAQVRVDYGSVLCKLGNYDEAITQYEQVVKNGPEYLRGQTLFFLGLAQEKTGKTNEAMDTYSKLAAGKGVYLGELVDMASFALACLEQKTMQPAAIDEKAAAAPVDTENSKADAAKTTETKAATDSTK